MVCGKGEGNRWLKQVLDQRKELVDDMIICGNNVDRKTEKIIKKYDFWFYKDNREWGIYQPRIKINLLNKCAKLNPDWILPSDADEVYDKHFTREEAEKLMATEDIGFYFAIINLWDDEQHYRHDLSFWNIRFWNFKKTKPFGLYFERKKVHCGLAPPIVYKYGSHAPFLLKHYGLMNPEHRKEKVKRYEKYDPKAIYKGREYYDKLKTNELVRTFNEEVMHKRVKRDVEALNEKPKKIHDKNKRRVTRKI